MSADIREELSGTVDRDPRQDISIFWQSESCSRVKGAVLDLIQCTFCHIQLIYSTLYLTLAQTERWPFPANQHSFTRIKDYTFHLLVVVCVKKIKTGRGMKWDPNIVCCTLVKMRGSTIHPILTECGGHQLQTMLTKTCFLNDFWFVKLLQSYASHNNCVVTFQYLKNRLS